MFLGLDLLFGTFLKLHSEWSKASDQSKASDHWGTRALSGSPKADIHSANIPMVIYHVFGVFHIHWGIFQSQKASDPWGTRAPITGGRGLRVSPIFKVLFSGHVHVSTSSRVTGSNFFRGEAATKKAPRQFKGGSRHIGRPGDAGAISAVFEPKILVFCMDTHFSSQ